MSACSTTVSRFDGPAALEMSLLCRPSEGAADLGAEVEVVYRALASRLAADGATFEHLATERVLLRDVRRDLPAVLDGRARVLAEVGQVDQAPPLTAIQQPPAGTDVGVELVASALVPRDRKGWAVSHVAASPECACEGCRRSAARLVRVGGQTSLYTGMIYGAGSDPYEEALGMFHAAERLVEQCGLSFRDVVRTWIYVRDIDRDYDALNRARREFFRRRGIERRPASTGVQGVPFPDEHDFAMTLQTLKAPGPLDVSVMSAPTLNEAWSYGADFSRGLRVVDANKVGLYVSGTASIDESGRTAHVGDFRAQADRMLRNIESLLMQQGAGFADLLSAVAYVKHRTDAGVLQAMFADRGFDGFPCSILEAPLCRPELLCETEAMAMLPPGPARA